MYMYVYAVIHQFNRSCNTFWRNFNKAWQQCPRMPEKCWVTSVTEMDGKVYVSALLSNPSSQVAPFMYNINKKQWSTMLTLSRMYFKLVAVHSKKQLLAIGGSIDGAGLSTMSNRIFVWNEKQPVGHTISKHAYTTM